MKKIDAILNREQEKYPALINKLSMILEPFALLATGNAPVDALLKKWQSKSVKNVVLSYSA